jgi:hypothetical protein
MPGNHGRTQYLGRPCTFLDQPSDSLGTKSYGGMHIARLAHRDIVHLDGKLV